MSQQRILTSRSRRSVGGAARLAATGLLAVTLVASGCGNDDDGDEAKDPSPTTAVAAAEFAAFCDNVVAADAAVSAAQGGPEGPPDEAAVTAAIAAMNAVADEAPDEIADAVDTMVADGVAMFESETGEPGAGFAAAAETTYGWVGDNCGFGVVDVAAKDYSYEGMPGDLDAGPAVVHLSNEGTELHEMLFVRVNDDVDDSTEDLLAMPEDEVMSKIEMKGAVFAMPGESAHSTVDLDPGRYIVVCFIPVGLTPEAAAAAETGGAAPEGPPHFTQGMVHDITVA